MDESNLGVSQDTSLVSSQADSSGMVSNQKLLDMEQKLKDHDQKLQMLEKEHKNENHEGEIKELERKMEQQIQELSGKLKRMETRFSKQFEEMSNYFGFIGFFKISNLKTLINGTRKWVFFGRSQLWNSRCMFTHVCGYKFYVEIKFSLSSDKQIKYGGVCGLLSGAYLFGLVGAGPGAVVGVIGATYLSRKVWGERMYAGVHFVQGEYNDDLKWPVKAIFTLEIINQRNGKNAERTVTCESNRPGEQFEDGVESCESTQFTELMKCNSMFENFVVNDTVHIQIIRVEFLDS